MPPPPQQQSAPAGRSRVDWTTLCCLILAVLLIVGFAVFIAWINLYPRGPRFAVASLTILSGGQVTFNLTDSNPNRHFGISYDGPATWASLIFHDEIIASGTVFGYAGDWHQPSMNTTSIAGVIDVVENEPSFSAALREGRLHLRLRLATAITFTLRNVLPAGEKYLRVNCDVLVGADGSLLRESVGAPCHSYFSPLEYDG